MNITSIGGRELYSILLGKESPFGSSSSVELNETLEGSRIDISKVLNTDPTKFQVTDIQNDMSKLKQADYFETSASFDLAKLPKDTSSDYFERANDIDVNDKHIQSIVNNYVKVSLGSGMVGGIPTRKEFPNITEIWQNVLILHILTVNLQKRNMMNLTRCWKIIWNIPRFVQKEKLHAAQLVKNGAVYRLLPLNQLF